MGFIRWPVKQKKKFFLNNDSYLFSQEIVSRTPYYYKTVYEKILIGNILIEVYEVFVNVCS